MQYVFFLLGTLFVVWGMTTWIMRDRKPEWFPGYAALRQKHDEATAKNIHTAKHVVGLGVMGVLIITYGYFTF